MTAGLAQIALALIIVFAITFILSRFFRIGRVVGLILGSVLVAAMRIIPQDGPVADFTDLLGNIGILVTLFLAGNAFDTKGVLSKAKPWFLIAGQMLLMTFFGALIGRSLGNPTWAGAFVIGFTLMQSSTAIVVDALKKRRWQDEPVGILAITLMVIQDIASGSMPLVIGLMAGSQSQGIDLVWTIILAVCLTGLFLLGPFIGKHLLGHHLSPEESPFLLGLFIALGIAMVAENAGIAAASAAFLAGLFWRRTQFINKTEAQLELIQNLLMPIFFISALRAADLSLANLISLRTWFIIIFELVASVIITYPLARLAGIGPLGSSLLTISSAQVGEFTFLVVLLGTRAGLMSAVEGGSLAIASVITFFITAVTVDFVEPIFNKLNKFIGFFDKQALIEKTQTSFIKPPSVVFLDVPEGTESDVKSALLPWIKLTKRHWPKTNVLVVEAVQDYQEEKFLESLKVDLLVREPYLDPVSLLKSINLKQTKVIISGPALGLRQDLDIIKYLTQYHPNIHLITIASNLIEAEELEKAHKNNPNVTVINETRYLAKNIGRTAKSF